MESIAPPSGGAEQETKGYNARRLGRARRRSAVSSGQGDFFGARRGAGAESRAPEYLVA